jgi:AcrR family transcriptional regulator
MPRIVDHHERRREISHAVWQVVVTQGFEAISLRNVAAEAGISVGRIQHYFATKDEMVRYGCRALVDQAGELYKARTAGLAPAEALRFLLTHSIPTTETLRIGVTLWYAYLAKSTDDPEIAAELLRAQHDAEDEAVRLIREATADRAEGAEPPSEESRQLARRLLATADGLVIRVLLGKLDANEATDLLTAELSRAGIQGRS